MSDFVSSNPLGGQNLSRQISRSLMAQPSLTEYNKFFRLNSNREDGIIQMKIGANDSWVQKLCVFEDGVLKHAPYHASKTISNSSFELIPMDKVIKLRTDNTFGDSTILITTTDGKVYLRFAEIDEMRKWLFCFQKSVALVLTHLRASVPFHPVDNNENSSNIWLKELGHGHGLHRTHALSRYASDPPHQVSGRALTAEDVYEAMKDKAVTGNVSELMRINSRNSSQKLPSNNDSSNSYLSASIPIVSTSRMPTTATLQFEDKVAASYEESADRYEKLENIVNRLSSDYRSSDRNSESDLDDPSHTAKEDDDYLMFELEPDNANTTRHSHSNPGTGQSSVNHGTPCQQNFLRWVSGYCTKLGPRPQNEDRLICAPDLSCSLQELENVRPAEIPDIVGEKSAALRGGGSRVYTTTNPTTITKFVADNHFDVILDSSAYFAVYDGHAGIHASAYLQNHLMQYICRHGSFADDIDHAITETCREIDQEFLEICRKSRMECGTTALGAFIVRNHLTVFSIGDCQAVLCSGGLAVEMNDPHKPGRPDEVERVTRANGWVTTERELYMGRLHRMANHFDDPLVLERAQQVNWVTIHRVCGELAVSRSIGDPSYKSFIPGEKVKLYFDWPAGHNQVYHADLVIPDPEFKTHEIGSEDEFLIIASDGLWDVVSTTEAVSIARGLFQAESRTPSEVAEHLCELAIKLGSSDNVTIVIVRFMHDE